MLRPGQCCNDCLTNTVAGRVDEQSQWRSKHHSKHQGPGYNKASNRAFALQEAEIARALADLLVTHFDPTTHSKPRLRQCLSVFFPAYAAASSSHQQHLARAFRRAARGALGVAPGKKAPAPQVMRYMLQVTCLNLKWWIHVKQGFSVMLPISAGELQNGTGAFTNKHE